MALSIYILNAVIVMPIVLAAVSNGLRKMYCEKFDNNNPRQQMAQLEGLPARALAAQQNAWEAAIIFMGAFFVAYLKNVPLEQLDTTAIVFLVARILHAVFYLVNWGTLRSVIFGVGIYACLHIAFMEP